MRSSNYEQHHEIWIRALNFGYVAFIVITPAAGALLKVDASDLANWPGYVVTPTLKLKEHAATLVIAAPIVLPDDCARARKVVREVVIWVNRIGSNLSR